MGGVYVLYKEEKTPLHREKTTHFQVSDDQRHLSILLSVRSESLATTVYGGGKTTGWLAGASATAADMLHRPPRVSIQSTGAQGVEGDSIGDRDPGPRPKNTAFLFQHFFLFGKYFL